MQGVGVENFLAVRQQKDGVPGNVWALHHQKSLRLDKNLIVKDIPSNSILMIGNRDTMYCLLGKSLT